MRRGIALLAALAFCGAATAAAPSSVLRLATAAGAAGERLTVWTKTDAAGEICAGSRAGPSPAAPASFTCLQRGLEPPLLEFESGGGLGAVATWGVISGLASPAVRRIEAETLYGTKTSTPLTLHAVPSLPGWHSFTTGVVPHPTSTQIAAYSPGGALLTRASGALIHPAGAPTGPIPVPGQPPTGAAWSASTSNLGPLAAAASNALPTALTDPALAPIIRANHAWLDTSGTWSNCSGRTLGRILTFRFAAPASFTATLPFEGKPAGNFSYSETVQRIHADNWPGMMVFVDTSSNAVVGVRPDLGNLGPGPTNVESTPLATIVAAHDAGGPDNSSCWQSGD